MARIFVEHHEPHHLHDIQQELSAHVPTHSSLSDVRRVSRLAREEGLPLRVDAHVAPQTAAPAKELSAQCLSRTDRRPRTRSAGRGWDTPPTRRRQACHIHGRARDAPVAATTAHITQPAQSRRAASWPGAFLAERHLGGPLAITRTTDVAFRAELRARQHWNRVHLLAALTGGPLLSSRRSSQAICRGPANMSRT